MIKVAQLGAERMGAAHARNAATIPTLGLIALVDTRPEASLAASITSFELAEATARSIVTGASVKL